jgi:hypothetical protein
MAEPDIDDDQPEDHYEIDTVEANLARQQGLGFGARDLAAQEDPQVAVSEDENEEDAEEA